MIEYIILGLLYVKARSGYEIKKTIEENISMFYRASNGSIYPALRKLEQKRWINMNIDTASSREKKIYKVTEEGQEIFKQWLEQPIQYTASNGQECVKVFFYDLLEETKRLELLTALEESIKESLKELYGFREQCKAAGYEEKRYYRMSTLYYGIGIGEGTLRWCQSIKEQRELSLMIEGE
ncbi:MAG: PadR family transcriptional regulator [Cellulosilyticum sp.]|nr:PadR family transcriptional regulator [Cellulosilyticum sp.]